MHTYMHVPLRSWQQWFRVAKALSKDCSGRLAGEVVPWASQHTIAYARYLYPHASHPVGMSTFRMAWVAIAVLLQQVACCSISAGDSGVSLRNQRLSCVLNFVFVFEGSPEFARMATPILLVRASGLKALTANRAHWNLWTEGWQIEQSSHT